MRARPLAVLTAADNVPEAHPYDDEFTVVLGDWYRASPLSIDALTVADDEHASLNQRFLSIANPGGAEPVPGASPLMSRSLTAQTRA